MYKRTVTYTDYMDNERKEDFYFHLNKAEIIQWLICNGGITLDQQLRRLYETSRGKDIMDIFEDLLCRSYGKKSVDGRRFDKSDELWKDFRATEAYSIIFTDLVTDAKKAAAFLNSIVPKSMAGEINQIMEDNKGNIPDELLDYMSSDILDEDGEIVSTENVPPQKEVKKPQPEMSQMSMVSPLM